MNISSRSAPDKGITRRSTTRLVLGTAQLGMPYGIANASGQPEFAEIRRIIRAAFESGITEFDTAQAYGTSEEVLGRAFDEMQIASQVKVVTKLHPETDYSNIENLRNSVLASLRALRVPQFHGLLLHREECLNELENDPAKNLSGLVREGIVNHIGVSVYSPEKAKQALKIDLIDIVQIPTSIVDRRFINAGVFDAADKSHKKLYVRSAFLQGLILMRPDSLPVSMEKAAGLLKEIEDISNICKLSAKSAALLYLRERTDRARVVFGAESADQVKQNIEIWKKEELSEGSFREIEKKFQNVGIDILNPSLWPVRN